jgi:DNA-directed RNA polymerase subunit F
MNYKQAKKVLENKTFAKRTELTSEQLEAIEKAKQAINDCLEMGLNGEGE